MSPLNMNRGELSTEQRNPRSARIDRLPVEQVFDIINAEDTTVAPAVAAARAEICQAIDLIVDRLRRGGRLVYVGAGTSGRLGVLDAAECPPTFLSDPNKVQAIIAGGNDALVRSIEGAEDDPGAAAQSLEELEVGPADVVFAISTGGTTPFAHGAINYAKKRGAATVFLACVPYRQVPDHADVSIRVITGPEVIAGSTRMKAGTATKMVLNLVSTVTMVRLGKVYQNLMVDVSTHSNEKLIDRGARILQAVTVVSRTEALSALEAAGGRVKTAIVMHKLHLDRLAAEKLIGRHHGRLADVIENGKTAPVHDR